jgi:hypothetical protein
MMDHDTSEPTVEITVENAEMLARAHHVLEPSGPDIDAMTADGGGGPAREELLRIRREIYFARYLIQQSLPADLVKRVRADRERTLPGFQTHGF